MKSFLVTGGAGFIGSHLTETLINQGHHVIVLDDLSTGKIENLPPKAEFIQGDICNEELLLDLLKKVDGCFHMAAILGIRISKEKWIETNRINLQGTITLFDAASKIKSTLNKSIPIIYASSCAVYGDAQKLPLPEDLRVFPLSAYGADKLSCEFNAFVGHKVHHLNAVGLRFFNVYGPRQRHETQEVALITSILTKIQHNLPVEIYGDGEQTRDYVHVKDVVSHCVFFMENIQHAPGVFNVCTGKAISVNDLLSNIRKVLKKDFTVIYHPSKPGDAIHSRGNPNKARKLGISTRISLREGLRDLLKEFHLIKK